MVRIALLLAVAFGTAAAQEGGKPLVEVKKFPHTQPCPGKCKTCTDALKRALDYLAGELGESGLKAGFAGDVSITALAGLAFMANGATPSGGPYSEAIEKAAKFVIGRIGTRTTGTNVFGDKIDGIYNWDLAFGALFLTEYDWMNPTPEVGEKLPWIVKKLCEQQESTGGWGHTPNFMYGDLVVATYVCLAGLGAAKAAKVPVPNEAITKAVAYFEASTEGSIVGYSPRPQQKGFGFAGRASGAMYAMARCGLATPFSKRITDYVRKNLKTIPKDHNSPSMQYLFGGLFAYMLGKDAWAEYRSLFLDLWLSAQQQDGSLKCPTESDTQAQKGVDYDGMIGTNYVTSVFALVFALPLENTNLTRLKPKGVRSPKVPQPWMGVRVEVAEGLVVRAIAKGSPAEKAGLATGDAILEINRKAVKDAKAARELLGALKPGSKASLTVQQSGKKKTVDVVLGEKPRAADFKGEDGEEPPGEDL